jgi:hypothetical protein
MCVCFVCCNGRLGALVGKDGNFSPVSSRSIEFLEVEEKKLGIEIEIEGHNEIV